MLFFMWHVVFGVGPFHDNAYKQHCSLHSWTRETYTVVSPDNANPTINKAGEFCVKDTEMETSEVLLFPVFFYALTRGLTRGLLSGQYTYPPVSNLQRW